MSAYERLRVDAPAAAVVEALRGVLRGRANVEYAVVRAADAAVAAG